MNAAETVEIGYRKRIDAMTIAQRVQRAVEMLAWARGFVARQVLAERGPLPEARLIGPNGGQFMFMTSAALLLALITGTGVSIESRTLAPRGAKPEGVNLVLNERIVTGGGFVFLGRIVGLDGSIGFSQAEYKMDGTPVSISQEGFWSDRWNHFETRYGKKGAEQQINEKTTRADLPDSTFRNPTLLWFWKTQPKPHTKVTVTSLAQNVIRTSQIEYTYEGDEEMTLVGRKVRVHRVREVPLPIGEGVYTIWWYDDQGMGVKRYHKTPENEYTDELVAWH